MDNIFSGPFSQTIIFDNEYHMSEDVWTGQDIGTLKFYCGSTLLPNWKLSDAWNALLNEMRFDLFANNNVVLQNDTTLHSFGRALTPPF